MSAADVPDGGAATTGMPVLVVRDIPHASPQDVWRALKDPAAVRRWWSPGGTTVETVQVELRAGGILRVVSRGRGLTYEVLGSVVSADPFRSFRTTWRWIRADPGLVSTDEGKVTVVLELLRQDDGSATRVSVSHEGLAGEQRERNAQGWARALEGVEECLREG